VGVGPLQEVRQRKGGKAMQLSVGVWWVGFGTFNHLWVCEIGALKGGGFVVGCLGIGGEGAGFKRGRPSGVFPRPLQANIFVK